jgi:hypothetical protein
VPALLSQGGNSGIRRPKIARLILNIGRARGRPQSVRVASQ